MLNGLQPTLQIFVLPKEPKTLADIEKHTVMVELLAPKPVATTSLQATVDDIQQKMDKLMVASSSPKSAPRSLLPPLDMSGSRMNVRPTPHPTAISKEDDLQDDPLLPPNPYDDHGLVSTTPKNGQGTLRLISEVLSLRSGTAQQFLEDLPTLVVSFGPVPPGTWTLFVIIVVNEAMSSDFAGIDFSMVIREFPLSMVCSMLHPWVGHSIIIEIRHCLMNLRNNFIKIMGFFWLPHCIITKC